MDGFHFETAEMLSWWFWVQYFKERHFKCPLLFLQHPWLAPCQTRRNLIPIFQSESSYLCPYLLCWPFLMGMLCVFVGKVLELLWKCDAGNRVWQLVSLCLQMCTTEVTCCEYQADRIFLIVVWLQRGLLSGTDGFWVKVALSVDRNRLFHSGADGGVHVVRRQSSSYGTEARHGHLEKLWVIFLHGERNKA